MGPVRFGTVVLACFIGAFLGDYSYHIAVRPALADLNSGNGGGGITGGGTTQTGADPGGGLCSSGASLSLCNPITGTTTFSNATPLAFSNTTGPNIVTSAATTGAAFEMKVNAATTGDMFDVINSSAQNCFAITTNGTLSMTGGSGCTDNVTIAGSFTPSIHYNQSAGCSGATPQTGRSACRITSASSTATVNFNNAFTSIPACTATDETTALALKAVPATGSVTITGQGASDVIDVVCQGNPS